MISETVGREGVSSEDGGGVPEDGGFLEDVPARPLARIYCFLGGIEQWVLVRRELKVELSCGLWHLADASFL